MHFHVPSCFCVLSLLSLTRCLLAFCAFLWHLGSCSHHCLVLAQAEFRVTVLPLLGQVWWGNDGDKNLYYMLNLCSAQAHPSFCLAAMKSGIFGVHHHHWPLEGTSVLLPPLQMLPFTLSAFKELHCFFLACSFVEMDHLHCIALKISRPQQSESSPGNLLSYMAFNRNPWGGTVKNRISFTPLKPGKPAEKLEQFQLLKTALYYFILSSCLWVSGSRSSGCCYNFS